jgi:hypothetical protein
MSETHTILEAIEAEEWAAEAWAEVLREEREKWAAGSAARRAAAEAAAEVDNDHSV